MRLGDRGDQALGRPERDDSRPLDGIPRTHASGAVEGVVPTLFLLEVGVLSAVEILEQPLVVIRQEHHDERRTGPVVAQSDQAHHRGLQGGLAVHLLEMGQGGG